MCTLEDLRHITATNNKQRFQLQELSGDMFMRACQGRYISEVLDDALLTRLSLDDAKLPEVCVHCTYVGCLRSIFREGLRTGDRNHIHFLPFHSGDARIISGPRPDCGVAIYIDMNKAMRSGVPLPSAATRSS